MSLEDVAGTRCSLEGCTLAIQDEELWVGIETMLVETCLKLYISHPPFNEGLH